MGITQAINHHHTEGACVDLDCAECRRQSNSKSGGRKSRKLSAPECHTRPRKTSAAAIRTSTIDPKLRLSNNCLLPDFHELSQRKVNEKKDTVVTTNNDSTNVSEEVYSDETKCSITKEESSEKEVVQSSKTLTKVEGLRRSVSFSGKSRCYNY